MDVAVEGECVSGHLDREAPPPQGFRSQLRGVAALVGPDDVRDSISPIPGLPVASRAAAELSMSMPWNEIALSRSTPSSRRS